jgi:hypothetical protein
MCRNIRTLHHFEPPATPEEIEASALQFVRKLSGMRAPSKANEAVFAKAVADVTRITTKLLSELETNGPTRNREVEQKKAKERFLRRGRA